MAAIHDARMLNHLLRELEPFGIRGDRIEIVYHAYMQDYDILISGGALTERQIEGIWAATRMGGVVRFTDSRNTDCWHALLAREAQKLMSAQDGS